MDFYNRNAHLFKLETIEKHVKSTYSPTLPRFAIGLGNTSSDMYAYDRASLERIYWIDNQSIVHSLAQGGAMGDTPAAYEKRKDRRFQMGFQDKDLLPDALGHTSVD
jgi:hypothetical protein